MDNEYLEQLKNLLQLHVNNYMYPTGPDNGNRFQQLIQAFNNPMINQYRNSNATAQQMLDNRGLFGGNIPQYPQY